jgi:molecular chaperone GrpE
MYYRNQHPAYRIPVRAANRRNPYSTRSGDFPVEEVETVEPVFRSKQNVNGKVSSQKSEPETPVIEPTPTTNSDNTKPVSDEPDWEAIAKRQQAEMDNFRKRQQRRADESVSAERERLLRLILPAADNLTRALKQGSAAENSLRQGVELTRREFERVLIAEGVTRIETVGSEFNPEWHEALATVPNQGEANTVVEEIEAGYRLNDKLLRPAKVIVAA